MLKVSSQKPIKATYNRVNTEKLPVIREKLTLSVHVLSKLPL